MKMLHLFYYNDETSVGRVPRGKPRLIFGFEIITESKMS